MKLEVLKAYKDLFGERAVVTSGPDKDGLFLVWHEYDYTTYLHYANGYVAGNVPPTTDLHEIVSEWVELRKGEFWVNIHGDDSAYVWSSREIADQQQDEDRIACVRVKWVEGQGLESESAS